MKQEDKDLLIKDLSSRLPYGVILECADLVGEELRTMTKEGLINDDYDIDEVKPMLFPLSSMTLDQMEEFGNLLLEKYKGVPEDNVETVGLVRDYESKSVLFKVRNKTTGEIFLSGSVSKIINNTPLEYSLDWFLENHFDWRGLIPLGLAKDATGLGIY